jgi:hypothetical protein
LGTRLGFGRKIARTITVTNQMRLIHPDPINQSDAYYGRERCADS